MAVATLSAQSEDSTSTKEDHEKHALVASLTDKPETGTRLFRLRKTVWNLSVSALVVGHGNVRVVLPPTAPQASLLAPYHTQAAAAAALFKALPTRLTLGSLYDRDAMSTSARVTAMADGLVPLNIL